MLQDIWDSVSSAISAGKSIEEVIADDPTEKYKGGAMGAMMIQSIFAELGTKK